MNLPALRGRSRTKNRVGADHCDRPLAFVSNPACIVTRELHNNDAKERSYDNLKNGPALLQPLDVFQITSTSLLLIGNKLHFIGHTTLRSKPIGTDSDTVHWCGVEKNR